MDIQTQQQRWLGRNELKAWLAPQQGPSTSFVTALLEDLFADDASVQSWLARPRREFRGRSAADLLRDDRVHEVEALLVQLWNRPLTLYPIASRERDRRVSAGRRQYCATVPD